MFAEFDLSTFLILDAACDLYQLNRASISLHFTCSNVKLHALLYVINYVYYVYDMWAYDCHAYCMFSVIQCIKSLVFIP